MAEEKDHQVPEKQEEDIESGSDCSESGEFWSKVKHIPLKKQRLIPPTVRKLGRDYSPGLNWSNPVFWSNKNCYRIGSMVRIRRQRLDNGKHWFFIRRRRMENGAKTYQWLMLQGDVLESLIEGLECLKEEIQAYDHNPTEATLTSKLPFKATKYSAGFDVFSDEVVVIPANGSAIISTGLVAMFTIHVSAGVIDPYYRGIVKVLMFNASQNNCEIPMGVRIAQLVVVRIDTPMIYEVSKFSKTERGLQGFGSTDRRSIHCYVCNYYCTTPIVCSTESIFASHENSNPQCHIAKNRDSQVAEMACKELGGHFCRGKVEMNTNENPPVINLPKVQRSNRPSDEYHRMYELCLRIQSFVDYRMMDVFPHLNIRGLANVGFFYEEPNNIRCAFCGIWMDINELDHKIKPRLLHQQFDRDCKLVRQKRNRRIPVKYAGLINGLLKANKTSHRIQIPFGGDCNVKDMKYKVYRLYQARLCSFNGLHFDEDTKVNLAQQGIFAIRLEDKFELRCYSCGLEVDQSSYNLKSINIEFLHEDLDRTYCNHYVWQHTSDRDQEDCRPCVRCYYNPVQVEILPCQHRPFCSTCAEEITDCPFCLSSFKRFRYISPTHVEWNGSNAPGKSFASRVVMTLMPVKDGKSSMISHYTIQ